MGWRRSLALLRRLAFPTGTLDAVILVVPPAPSLWGTSWLVFSFEPRASTRVYVLIRPV